MAIRQIRICTREPMKSSCMRDEFSVQPCTLLEMERGESLQRAGLPHFVVVCALNCFVCTELLLTKYVRAELYRKRSKVKAMQSFYKVCKFAEVPGLRYRTDSFGFPKRVCGKLHTFCFVLLAWFQDSFTNPVFFSTVSGFLWHV